MALVGLPPGLGAQDGPGAADPAGGDPAPAEAPAPTSDSLRHHAEARAAQTAFERLRISLAPRSWRTFTGGCDEIIGRFCLGFGTADLPPDHAEAWRPPEEPASVREAREDLLERLAIHARALPGDGWIRGQRVAYLVEAGRSTEAVEVARACPPAPDPGWCLALQGFALHAEGAVLQAEAAFEGALAFMAPEEARRWADPTILLPGGTDPRPPPAAGAGPAGRDPVWTLADPLYLVPGNDRWTEHLSRWTLARIRAEARTPYSMRWGEDLEALLVRYGAEVAFEQQRAPALNLGPTPVLGRLHPDGRAAFPGADGIRDPAGIEPGRWGWDDRRGRERHRPAYASRLDPLPLQEARFERGEAALLVLAWGGPSAPAPGGIEEGIFLVTLPERSVPEAPAGLSRRTDPLRAAGVATLRVPPGDHLLSVERLDREEDRAWRARHGLRVEPPARGVIRLSDLLLLDPAPGSVPEIPSSLDDVLDRALPGGPIPGDAVEIAWEVYDLPAGLDRVRYRIVAEPTGETFLRRAARFLRILSPDERIEISWTEGAPDGHGEPGAPSAPSPERPSAFRTVRLDLSALPPGAVRLRLELALPGREPARSETVFERGP